jgi:hypothetical protein
VDILEKESLNLIHWFSHNQMKANPDKFQAIAIGIKVAGGLLGFSATIAVGVDGQFTSLRQYC